MPYPTTTYLPVLQSTSTSGEVEQASTTLYNLPEPRVLSDIRSGIGDGIDLKVKMKVSVDGKWYPILHTGWYYIGESERFLYSNKQTLLFSGSSSGNCSSSSITSNLFLDYGPVTLTDTTNEITLDRISTSPRFVLTTDWSLVAGTTDKWQWESILYPIEIYRKSLDEPMQNVPIHVSDTMSTRYETITDEFDYTLETEKISSDIRYKITVASTSAPSGIYIFCLSELDSLITLIGVTNVCVQDEICLVDINSNVRVMCSEIETDYVSRLPVVTHIIDGVASISTIQSTSVSGNQISLLGTSASAAQTNDRVVVTYLPKNSYLVDDDTVYFYSENGCSLSLDYEGSDIGWWSSEGIETSGQSYIQLNPITSGIESGFLYLEDSTLSLNKINTLSLHISPIYVSIDSVTNSGPPIRMVARVIDSDNNPVENTPVTAVINGAGYLSGVFPESGNTDWRGEVVYSWCPTGVGTTTITGLISGDVEIKTITQADFAILTANGTTTQAKKLYLMIYDTNLSLGKVKVIGYATTIDGMFPIQNIGITFESSKSKFSKQNVFTDESGLAENEYYVVAGDSIRISAITSGNRKIYSNEIKIGNM